MKIICPGCQMTQEVHPEEVIGRLYICRHCHCVFQWAWHGTERKNNAIEEKIPRLKNSPKDKIKDE